MKRETLLFEQLLGAYYAFPIEGGVHSTTNNSSHWGSLNMAIDELVLLGHAHYDQFKVTPSSSYYNGVDNLQVNIAHLRMNMMSVLRLLGREFDLGDPAYLLSRYSSQNNFSLNQTASPTTTNTQNQSQSQQIEITLEQKLLELQKIVDENLSSEQFEQIREPLEVFKKNPNVWRNAQKLILFGANFSRDVAVEFISTVLVTFAAS